MKEIGKTGKEKKKITKKYKRGQGDQIGPAAEAAPAQYHLNLKGYLPPPLSH
jgi:hypothetical protein